MLRTAGPLSSTPSIGAALPPVGDEPMHLADQQQRPQTQEKVTFASKVIKELSLLRSDPRYADRVRSADIGQAWQIRLNSDPPRILPEYDIANLVNFFECWVQEQELGMTGLAVIQHNSKSLGDVVPPMDFVWLDGYLCDPSTPSVHEIPPLPEINGQHVTDERCVNCGCDCPQDQGCDPKTCACLRRAADCYPYSGSYYHQQLLPPSSSEAAKPNFAYDEYGRIRKEVLMGTPIFECNKHCSCSSECSNRVVQKGRKAPLAFWKTEDKGWGIRAMEELPVGTFVGTYGGELLNDKEGDRRAFIYEELLGTTYLQMLDSHNIKVHLTRQILEKDLAEKKELDKYRSTEADKRKLVDLITTIADEIEKYDEYFHYLELHPEVEPGLFELEARIKECKCNVEEGARLLVRAKENAYTRVTQAKKRRAKERAQHPTTDPEGAPTATEIENESHDAIWNFLSLSPADQDRARRMRHIRSDMEDEQLVTVDSSLWGNHTRFFNHSCDPNIYHVPVYIDDTSIMRPLLAFFTFRPVKAGDELCFSYSGDTGMGEDGQANLEPSSSAPQSPSKGRTRNKATMIHPPSTKPGAETAAAIIATPADSAAAATRPAVRGRLSIKCRCGAKNCTGRVFG